MNKQEAIDTLKANYPFDRYTMLRQAVDMAINELEKGIIKKPVGEIGTGWHCPNCESSISHEQQVMHCRQCGQLITWR